MVGYSSAVSVQCEEIRTESRWQRRMILTEVLGDSLRVCVRACVRACVCVSCRSCCLAMWFEFLVVNTTVTFRLCCLKFQGSCLNLISVQRIDLCIYVRGSRIANGLLSSSSFPIQWESLGWLQLGHAGEGECYPMPKPSQPRK